MAILTNEEVADRVRGVAAEKRLSRAEIAERLSVTPMSLSRRFNGQTPLTAAELSSLSHILSVPVSRFFGETDSLPPVAQSRPEPD